MGQSIFKSTVSKLGKLVSHTIVIGLFTGVITGLIVENIVEVREIRSNAFTILHQIDRMHREGIDENYSWSPERRFEELIQLNIQLNEIKPRLPNEYWDCIAARAADAKSARSISGGNLNVIEKEFKRELEQTRAAILRWYDWKKTYVLNAPKKPNC